MEEVWIVNAIYSYVNAACVLYQLSNVTQDARPMEHARSIAFTLLMRMRSTISIMGKCGTVAHAMGHLGSRQ